MEENVRASVSVTIYILHNYVVILALLTAHPLLHWEWNALMCGLELKQISEISGYPFEIHYPDTQIWNPSG